MHALPDCSFRGFNPKIKGLASPGEILSLIAFSFIEILRLLTIRVKKLAFTASIVLVVSLRAAVILKAVKGTLGYVEKQSQLGFFEGNSMHLFVVFCPL